MCNYHDDNDLRAQKIESFLIAEAIKAGVLSTHHISNSRNPNKWDKHLAPWFSEECKIAKAECKEAKIKFGNKSPPAIAAYKEYRKCCRHHRSKLQYNLPNMIKSQPKKFWKILRATNMDPPDLQMEQFAKHN